MTETHYILLTDIQAAPMPPGYATATGPMPHTLRNDLMFRIVFEANRDTLKALLCSLLHLEPKEITSVEITNPIRLGDYVGEKTYVLDINILLNQTKKIHLELQVLSQDFLDGTFPLLSLP
ncbi:MAG: PD-(D/E)XK nuclease family transposase [Lachnospiraceae bacterium]